MNTIYYKSGKSLGCLITECLPKESKEMITTHVLIDGVTQSIEIIESSFFLSSFSDEDGTFFVLAKSEKKAKKIAKEVRGLR